jgi:hypothetical protein
VTHRTSPDSPCELAALDALGALDPDSAGRFAEHLAAVEQRHDEERAVLVCHGGTAAGLAQGMAEMRAKGAVGILMEADTGQQTRLFRFGPASASTERTWQGNSKATWDRLGRSLQDLVGFLADIHGAKVLL